MCFVKLRAQCRELFGRSGVVELVGDEYFYTKIGDAVEGIRRIREVERVLEHERSLSTPLEHFVSFEEFPSIGT